MAGRGYVGYTSAAYLSRAAYRPRGGSPLYDAAARLITTVDAEIAKRVDLGIEREGQVVLIITDGAESQP